MPRICFTRVLEAWCQVSKSPREGRKVTGVKYRVKVVITCQQTVRVSGVNSSRKRVGQFTLAGEMNRTNGVTGVTGRAIGIFEPAEPVPLHSIFPEDDEPVKTNVDLSKLDKLIAQAVQMAEKKINEETSLKNIEQQTERVKKYVKKRKQTVEKRKEEEWEYDTPEGLKPAKRTKKNDNQGVSPNVERESGKEEGLGRIPRHRGRIK
ncbi:hypothetical protein ACLB2K_052628 [Fragaria x ananassa]